MSRTRKDRDKRTNPHRDVMVQRWNRKRIRHFIKMILHNRQFNRLHGNDHIEKADLE